MKTSTDSAAPQRDWPDWANTMRRDLPILLSRAEAAKCLGVNERTVDRRRRLGELESVVVGRRVLIPAESLIAELVAGRQGRDS